MTYLSIFDGVPVPRHLPLVCPSSNIDEPRAKLLGVPTPDGGLVFAKEPRPLTPEFIRRAKAGRDPSKRFRFTSPCIQKGCVQWKDERCSLVELVTGNDVSADRTKDDGKAFGEDCPIRTTCRWYAQRGDTACAICPRVIAHMFFGEEDEPAENHEVTAPLPEPER